MKFKLSFQLELLWHVAPLVGAWIEIKKQSEVDKQIAVAPLVGAWIEIADLTYLYTLNPCRSSCRSVD